MSGSSFVPPTSPPVPQAPTQPGTETFPPTGPTSLTRLIPSYLYQQYADDDDLQTFVGAQNYLAQQALNDLILLNSLAVWSALSGPMLDWIASGLYGVTRPILSYQKPAPAGGGVGPYDTMAYDTSTYGGGRLHPPNLNPVNYIPVTDDIYQRLLTWNLYRADGFQFTIPWLKRRIHRYLRGVNGYLAVEDNHYDVSIQSTGTAITIVCTSNEIGISFQYAVIDNVLALPFEFTYTVSPSVISFPNAGGGRVSATASFSGNCISLGGIIPGVLAGAGGASLGEPIIGVFWPLSGTHSGAGGIIGAPSGTGIWLMGGAIGGSAGVQGRTTLNPQMGGLFAGSAG